MTDLRTEYTEGRNSPFGRMRRDGCMTVPDEAKGL